MISCVWAQVRRRPPSINSATVSEFGCVVARTREVDPEERRGCITVTITRPVESRCRIDAEGVGDTLKIGAQDILARRAREQGDCHLVQRLFLADAPSASSRVSRRRPAATAASIATAAWTERRHAAACLDRERVIRLQKKK